MRLAIPLTVSLVTALGAIGTDPARAYGHRDAHPVPIQLDTEQPDSGHPIPIQPDPIESAPQVTHDIAWSYDTVLILGAAIMLFILGRVTRNTIDRLVGNIIGRLCKTATGKFVGSATSRLLKTAAGKLVGSGIGRLLKRRGRQACREWNW